MFDITHETKVEHRPTTPDAATKEAPVRVEVGGKVCWMRPSNVLRIEACAANAGWPDRVKITFSDGEELVYNKATAAIADTIAALLWPTDGSKPKA